MELHMMAEVELFVHTVLLGAILALVNEGVALLRRVWHHKTVAIAIEDVLFWIIAGILLIALIYQENDGAFRGFLLLGLGLGAGMMYFCKKMIGNWKLFKKIHKKEKNH